MKTRFFLLALLATLPSAASAAPITRSSTADALNTTAAWVGGELPTTANTATWDASSTLDNTLGANLTWGGLDVSAAAGAVSVSGNNNLLLDHSTDASTAFNTGATNFTWGAVPATGGTFHINGAAGSTSSTATGATFSGSGTVTIGGTGIKNWSTNATTNGVTNVTFTGTLALRGVTIPAVGVLPGNWLAFGGGGGAASDAGTTVQTGSFALDTGDASSCGALILTQGWSGQYLKLNSLSAAKTALNDIFRYAREPEVVNDASLLYAQIQLQENDQTGALATYKRMEYFGSQTMKTEKERQQIATAILAAFDLAGAADRSTDVLDSCDVYLKLYPTGDKVSEVRQKRTAASLKAAAAAAAPAAPAAPAPAN